MKHDDLKGKRLMMRKLLSLLLLIAALSYQAFAEIRQPQSSPHQSVAYSKEAVAFVNVNVIPMTGERVLREDAVIIRNELISAIGPAKRVKIPSDALRIDGRGRYLLPGLTDMHAHLFSDDQFPDELADEELFVMLAGGVMTRGRWPPESELQKMLEQIASRFQSAFSNDK
jgi:hypothetical protein